jgi:hypothetical protein
MSVTQVFGIKTSRPNVWAAQRRAVCGPSAAAAGWAALIDDQ